jgi:HAD superfamily hydrolase (TIGR01509 family)
MTHIRHVFFDNDGTLVDSEILAVRSMLNLLAAHGIDMSEQAYCLHFPGLRETDILAYFSEKHGVAFRPEATAQLRNLHDTAYEQHLKAIPGMDVVFKNLHLPKSMVSNGSVQHVKRCLRLVGLLDGFDGPIFSAEHVQRPKPHPDVYLHALQSLSLQAGEALAIEDSPTGVASAKAAGLTVVGFLGAAHVFDGHRERLLEQGADVIADDAAMLAKYLQMPGHG